MSHAMKKKREEETGGGKKRLHCAMGVLRDISGQKDLFPGCRYWLQMVLPRAWLSFLPLPRAVPKHASFFSWPWGPPSNSEVSHMLTAVGSRTGPKLDSRQRALRPFFVSVRDPPDSPPDPESPPYCDHHKVRGVLRQLLDNVLCDAEVEGVESGDGPAGDPEAECMERGDTPPEHVDSVPGQVPARQPPPPPPP